MEALDKTRNKGFSLVEVVVVLAILGILSLLILPMFARAKTQSRKVKCLSNLQQISLGTMQYVRDSTGRFPSGNAFWNTNLPEKYLANVMRPYVKLDAWDCPAWQAKYRSEDANSPGNYSFITGKNGVIGFPRLFSEPKKALLLLQVRNPGTYPLFFCGSAPSQVNDKAHMNAHSGTTDKRWLDGTMGGTSILYVDGHSKYTLMDRIKWNEIYSTNP